MPGRDLTPPSTDLSGDLALHQLPGEERDRARDKPLRVAVRGLATTSATVMLCSTTIVVFSYSISSWLN
jgi:hypothetical protein